MNEKSKFDIRTLTDMTVGKKAKVINYEDILNRIEEIGIEIQSAKIFENKGDMWIYFSKNLYVDVRKTEYEDMSFKIICENHDLYWPKSNRRKVLSNKLDDRFNTITLIHNSSVSLLRFEEMLSKIVKLINA